MLSKFFKKTVSFLMIVLIILFTAKQYYNHKYIVNNEQNSDEFFYDLKKLTRNNSGLFNTNNTQYIQNATNECFKSKILDLINDYNNNISVEFKNDFRTQIEKILTDNKTLFVGDSNVKHFLYYDLV